MKKQFALLATGTVAGMALVVSSLNAADAPAPAAASAKASASAAPKPAVASAASSASAAPAVASSTAPVAAKPDLSKLPTASDKKGLTFEKDIFPMFKASCSGCHVNATSLKGGLDLTTLEAALKGGRKNKDKDIVPGHGDQSFVLLYAADLVPKAEMPPLSGRTAHPALTKDQLADLRAWIDQGAK